jgi:hypothetical protein
MPPASHKVSATPLKLLIQQIHPHVRVKHDSGMCVARNLYELWGRSPTPACLWPARRTRSRRSSHVVHDTAPITGIVISGARGKDLHPQSPCQRVVEPPRERTPKYESWAAFYRTYQHQQNFGFRLVLIHMAPLKNIGVISPYTPESCVKARHRDLIEISLPASVRRIKAA